jgi:serine/threonine protein kinase/tetratricopeptide (TPR) repeat protein
MESPNQRIELANQLLMSALDLPPNERQQYIYKQCSEDADLAASALKLLDGFERLGSFMERPASHRRGAYGEVVPGTMLAGRFRVLQRVGAGGMGVVYQAHDFELNETVALKMITEEWALDAQAVLRFRDEISLARRVTHPNVCRINDVFRHSDNGRDLLFFSMEMLEGETLAQRMVSERKHSAEWIIRLVEQLAAGLDAVHAAGIVHRDLKPANIFLSKAVWGGERVVLTDFGLAKTIGTSEGGRTEAGAIVGSPYYMAPEQFLGDLVSNATDVYSMALVMYELAAGARPLAAEGVLRGAIRRITEDAPPLQAATHGLPAGWDRAIARALARDPGKRFQSAREFATALRAATQEPTWRISRRQCIAVGVSILSVSGFWFVRRYRRWDAAIPASPLVLMANLDSSLPLAATQSVDFLLRRQLDQSAHLRLVGQDRMSTELNRMESSRSENASTVTPRGYREIALREGAPLVLFGSLSQVGDDCVLSLKIELLENSTNFAGKTFTKQFVASGESALEQATGAAVSWVRRTLGESAEEIAARTRPPQELTTPDWNALQEFVRAENIWRASPQGSNSDQALAHLNTAIQLDPLFASAHARLGDYLVALGRTDDGLAEQQIAAHLISSRDLTDRESLRIRGMYYSDTGQYREAGNVYARWIAEYPADAVALFYRSNAVHREGATQESDRLLQEAIRLNPNVYAFGMWECLRLLEYGRFQEMERCCDALSKLQSADWTYQLRSALAFARFDIAGVWLNLEKMRTNGSAAFQSRAYTFEACLRYEQRRDAEVEPLLIEGIQFDRSNGLVEPALQKSLKLAEIRIAQGRFSEAVRECRNQIPQATGARLKMQIGSVLARAGDHKTAKECLLPVPDEQKDLPLLATPVYQHWRKRLELELALAGGDHETAAVVLSQIPPSETEGDWPEYRVRALRQLGRRGEVVSLCSQLLSAPGWYWFQAHRAPPGFFRSALETLGVVDNPDSNGRAKLLLQLLR